MKTCPPHAFDPVSGWCTRCIGYREDDRLISSGGGIFRPGKTTTETNHDREGSS